MSPTRTNVLQLVLLGIIPVVLGTVLIVWGLVERQWATTSVGAGLIGLPGVRESLKAVGDDGSEPIDSGGAVGV